MIPPPLRSSLMLDPGGVITSPPWLKWFSQLLLPAVQGAQDAEVTALAQALSKGGTSGGFGADADLSIPAFSPRATVSAGGDGFPPLTPRAVEMPDLSMLAASQFSRQQLPQIISDTHANRANYPASAFNGALFVESDRLVLFVASAGVWNYAGGQWDSTLSNIPTLATTDAGYLFGVTDYSHVLRWDGAAWGWAPGDGGSGMLALFEVDPGTGWHLYDGSTVNYLKADGTTGSVALPDLAGTAAYLKAGSPNSGPNAAVAPGLSMNPFTPAGSVTSFFSGSLINFTTSLFVATAGAVAALVSPTSITPAGSVASLFSGIPGTPTGTVDTTGQPRNLVRRPFFRQ